MSQNFLPKKIQLVQQSSLKNHRKSIFNFPPNLVKTFQNAQALVVTDRGPEEWFTKTHAIISTVNVFLLIKCTNGAHTLHQQLFTSQFVIPGSSSSQTGCN